MQRCRPSCVLGLVWISLIAAQSAAQPFLLGSSQSGQLFTVDVTSGASAFVAQMPAGLATEIELDASTGALWAEQVDGGPGLFRVDPVTGALLGGVDHAAGALNGLEFVGSTLYGTYIPGPVFPSELVLVDTSSGVLTPVGPTGFGPISGLAFDPKSGVMYGVTAGPFPALLVTIDLMTGAATPIGPTGLDRIGSIEFASDGNLYGGLTSNASQFPDHLVRIDVATGAATVIGDTGFSITGLTQPPNLPPECDLAAPDVAELWPPNHQLVDVSVEGVLDPEGDPVEIAVTQIAQDEPIEGRGDGNTEPDAEGIGSGVASLRAERTGRGDGRVYHVSFRAEDAGGRACEGAVVVCVPHDRGHGGGCVDQGLLFDSTTGEALPQRIGPENGGFETGDLTGWVVINPAAVGGVLVDDGSFDPPGPGGPVAPFAGRFAAVTFQGGPGIHTLYQDVTLDPALPSATLLWADRLENHAGIFVDPTQEWRVEVRDPANNGVLAQLFSTNPGDPPFQDWTERTADLGPWIGQTIRLAFTEQDFFDYFNARLDEVRIVTTTPLAVAVDVEPGAPRNFVDPAAQGLVSVAILGSESFDVSEVDRSTLSFGPQAAAALAAHAIDIDRDGVPDLVASYSIPEVGLAYGDTQACVTGSTARGRTFEGCDAVTTLRPGACGLGFELALLLPPLMWARRRPSSQRTDR